MSYRFVNPFTDVGPGLRPAAGAKLFFYDVGTANPKTTYADFALSIPNPHPVVADDVGVFGDIFLDGRADVTLNYSGGSLIRGPSTIYPPDDSVNLLGAENVTVADTAGYYTAADVEAALAELGLQGLRRDRPETINQSVTYNSAEVISPILRSFSVKHSVISSSAGTLTVDLSTGNSFATVLTENITISIVGASSNYEQFTLEITQDSGGGAYTVSQPAGVLTKGGAGYTMSTGNGAIDELTYRTINGGTTWKLDAGNAYA